MRFFTVLCLLLFGVFAAQAGERIIEVASGRELSVDQLLQQVRAADIVLLGERHDNARHHFLRGEMLRHLPAAVVVAEHLQSPTQVQYGPDLLAALVTAGFEAENWRWPLHQALFSPLAEKNIPLYGGNLARAQVRRIAYEGVSALPAGVIEMLLEAPLPPEAEAALDADLKLGHCGYLPAERLAGLRLAQRARDVTMFAAVRQQNGRPVVLVAGNGHVRSDYGIPVLLRHFLPEARWLSLGFEEDGADVLQRVPVQHFTHLWITAVEPGKDPCQQFKERVEVITP